MKYEENLNLEETNQDMNDGFEKTNQTNVDEETNGETQEVENEGEKEENFEVTYNGQKVFVSKDEAITYIQKGMNYDHTKGDLEKARKLNNGYKEALKTYGYDGDDEAIINEIISQATGKPVEEITKNRELEEKIARAEAIEEEHNRREALAKANEYLEKHLRAIKKAFPEETATKIQDIKNYDIFLRNVKQYKDFGDIDPVREYRIAMLDSNQGKPKVKENDKGHFVPVGGNSSINNEKEIPKEALGIWRDMYPELTASQLKEKYNKTFE